MVRGTTPTHVFRIPFDTSHISRAMVIYAQRDAEVFSKEDCVFSGNEIRVTLTQEDTLKLDHRHPAQIQLRILTHDGQALASNVKIVYVRRILNNEVI